MLSLEEIAEEAKAYANLTTEMIEGMDTAGLHEQWSKRIAAQEEVTASKKAFVGSATDLLKRIRGDILCLNHEIRSRFETEKEERHAAGSKTRADDADVIDLLPEPSGLAVV